MSKLYQVKKVVPQYLRMALRSNEAGICNISAVLNEDEGLDIQFGSILVNDTGRYSGLKGFDTMFPWHFWNVDDNDNVWDDMDNIKEGIEVNKFDCKPPHLWKIRLTDGSTWDCTENGRVSDRKIEKLRKDWNRWYKDYDAVYVYNLAFEYDYGSSYKNEMGMPFVKYKKQWNWDDAEEILLQAEQRLETFKGKIYGH